MISQPKQKGFFAKNWGWFLGGAALIGVFLLVLAGAGAFILFRQNVQVLDMSLSMDKPVYGQALTAKAMVENKGLLNATYSATLLVDGKESKSQEVELEPKKPMTLSFDISGLSPGKHTMGIGGEEVEFTVYRPAEFKVTGFTVEPESLMAGESVTVHATVSNSGDLEGLYRSALTCDGASAEACSVSVKPGESGAIDTQLVLTDRGEHTIALEGQQKTVKVLVPANITLTGVQLSKEYAEPKEAITIQATYSNTGDLAGSHIAELFVNGKSLQQMEIALEPGKATTVDFTVTEEKAGKYDIQIGGTTRTLFVVTITRPKNGALLVKKVNSGYGKLTLVNGSKEKDAIFVLASTADPKKPLLTVYVRKDTKASNIRVKDGTYIVYYTSGNDYDSASKRFITDPSFGMFDDPINYKTTRSGYTTYFSIWTISINIAGGDADSTPLDEDEFPK